LFVPVVARERGVRAGKNRCRYYLARKKVVSVLTGLRVILIARVWSAHLLVARVLPPRVHQRFLPAASLRN
jgi:hypothetical protein